MKTLVTISAFLFLVPYSVFGTECGSGTKKELQNLRTSRGAVVIDGVIRYGAADGCLWGEGLTPMFRYYPKQNTISLFHCGGGQVYWTEQDNINFVCENLGPDRRGSPNERVEEALREGDRYWRRQVNHRTAGKASGSACASASECASGECRRYFPIHRYFCR